jgi:hypothetical protein
LNKGKELLERAALLNHPINGLEKKSPCRRIFTDGDKQFVDRFDRPYLANVLNLGDAVHQF